MLSLAIVSTIQLFKTELTTFRGELKKNKEDGTSSSKQSVLYDDNGNVHGHWLRAMCGHWPLYTLWIAEGYGSQKDAATQAQSSRNIFALYGRKIHINLHSSIGRKEFSEVMRAFNQIVTWRGDKIQLNSRKTLIFLFYGDAFKKTVGNRNGRLLVQLSLLAKPVLEVQVLQTEFLILVFICLSTRFSCTCHWQFCLRENLILGFCLICRQIRANGNNHCAINNSMKQTLLCGQH